MLLVKIKPLELNIKCQRLGEEQEIKKLDTFSFNLVDPAHT